MSGGHSQQTMSHSADVEFDMAADWGGSWRIHAYQAGDTVLSCQAVQSELGLWYLEDFLPCRDLPQVGPVLVAVGRWLAANHAPSHVVALHPTRWDTHVAAAGGRLLHRVIHMGTVLDEAQLDEHARPLPDGYQFAPLTAETSLSELAKLSRAQDQQNDRKAWRNTLAGTLGPLIEPASLTVVRDGKLRAAVGVADYQGAALISHIVTAEAERGAGLGRTLLVESLRRLARSGYHECRLNVVEENRTAQQLYRSLGFTTWRAPLRASLLTPILEDSVD